jgi:hypothetical protein
MIPLLALTSLGCGGVADFNEVPEDSTEPSVPSPARLRIDVLPGAASTTSEIRALPSSIFREVLTRRTLDLGELALVSPVDLGAEVIATRTNPTVADLPGVVVPVVGTVSLRIPDSIVSWRTRTSADGRFDALVFPDGDYELSVVPDDPLVPTWVGPLGGVGELGTLDLGYGAPIFGIVSSPGGTLAGVEVFATSPEGVRTPSALTDDTGFYQLRVGPGTWTVTSAGRPLGLDAVLSVDAEDVGEDGVFVPFTYPDVPAALVSGSVTAPNGKPLAGAVVRFRSTRLPEYEEEGRTASWTGEVAVSPNGSYLVRVTPGEYDVELLPPVGDEGAVAVGPRLLSAVTVEGDAILDLEATPLRPRIGRVSDPSGSPIGGARVACHEVGFDQHEYLAFSDASGNVLLEHPPYPLQCEVGPPGERPDLASSLQALDGADRAEAAFPLVAGIEVIGTVAVDDRVEVGAVVQLRDDAGTLVGFDLTDEDGAFSVRIDPALLNAR